MLDCRAAQCYLLTELAGLPCEYLRCECVKPESEGDRTARAACMAAASKGSAVYPRVIFIMVASISEPQECVAD